MNNEKRIGLLAAWGRYPVLVAEALRENAELVERADTILLAHKP